VRSPSSGPRDSNRFALDPAQSQVGFTIRHLASKVRGRVTLLDGAVEYEPRSPGVASVIATMSVASIDTGNPIRDARLRSPEFFDAVAFPQITFTSRTAGRRGAGLEIPGNLTIRDTSVGVILRVTKLDPKLASRDDARPVRVTARARIRRSDFGIGPGAVLEAGGILIGDEVSIELDLVLIRA
jgi:polyisoprenoid-binding protein YceI